MAEEKETRKEEIPHSSKSVEQKSTNEDCKEKLTPKDNENSECKSQENKDQQVSSKNGEEQDQEMQKSGEQTKKPSRPRKVCDIFFHVVCVLRNGTQHV